MAKERPFSETFIDVGGDDVKLLKGMKVGSRVRVVLYGTLKAKSERSEDATTETVAGGSITLTVSKMTLASNSEIADLLDDDEDV